MRILVIEDDKKAAAYVVKGLAESSHTVDHASDGEEGFEMAAHGDYDVLVVDRMLPKLDGLTLVARLRGQGLRTPILFFERARRDR